MKSIKVDNTEITIVKHNGQDYISLTNMLKNVPNSNNVIGNWLRRKDTLEYLALWERLNNPDNFKLLDFEELAKNAGTNRFNLSPTQWIDKTAAIGIISRSGKGGGTMAHKDIAFHFAMWLSPALQLLIVTEYQRLKEAEQKQINPEWDFRRLLAKINYRTQTDAIKENIIPVYHHLTAEEERYIYATEAELINLAVFGITSKRWRQENPKVALDGYNIRDMANIPQLTVVSNLESYNAILISQGLPAKDRLVQLKSVAVSQLKSFSQYVYTYPIESPNSIRYEQTSSGAHSGFNTILKGVLDVPKSENDKGDK